MGVSCDPTLHHPMLPHITPRHPMQGTPLKVDVQGEIRLKSFVPGACGEGGEGGGNEGMVGGSGRQ